MADNKDKSGYKTVLRLIEYHGPIEWIEKTFSTSRMPIQGEFKPSADNEVFIRSGIVSWLPDEVMESQRNRDMADKGTDDSQVKVEGVEDKSATRTTVQFKRPGVN